MARATLTRRSAFATASTSSSGASCGTKWPTPSARRRSRHRHAGPLNAPRRRGAPRGPRSPRARSRARAARRARTRSSRCTLATSTSRITPARVAIVTRTVLLARRLESRLADEPSCSASQRMDPIGQWRDVSRAESQQAATPVRTSARTSSGCFARETHGDACRRRSVRRRTRGPSAISRERGQRSIRRSAGPRRHARAAGTRRIRAGRGPPTHSPAPREFGAAGAKSRACARPAVKPDHPHRSRRRRSPQRGVASP